MKLFIIPGHGAGDSGAVGNGYQEQERVRALAKRIKKFGGTQVILADFDRNYYADGGISTLKLSKDTQIVELHMDSASSTARGGHVIINGIYEPDSYDKALAKGIVSIFPGRAQAISKRNDLANPKRAAAKGYGYRLIECGFITNSKDVKIFNNKMDDIAKMILKSFGLKIVRDKVKKPEPSKPVKNLSTKERINESIMIIQKAINDIKTLNGK